MGVRVELQVAHESLNRRWTYRVDVQLLTDCSLLEFHVFQSLLLFQLRFKLLELFLRHVFLL